MRTTRLVLLTLIIVAIAGPALAQATSPYNVSWAALNPGDDWAAQVLRAVFPIGGTAGSDTTGNEASVIGQIVGQFTGFIAAIACAFVCYNTIMNIHRAAESSQILGSGQTWMFVVRTGFAGIMMFPLGGGFSAGQQMALQGAMWGIGMARVLYTNAVQAIGPDAETIALPAIPGTSNIVQGLIASEFCMDLINLAAGSANTGGQPVVPTPQPVTINNSAGGGYISWRYALSAGNETGDPVCGTVTVNEPASNETTVAGINIDMSAVQQAVLTNVLLGDIREPVANAATQLWTTKDASALTALQNIYTQAVNDYTQQLTIDATAEQSKINAALKSNAAQARNGNLDLLQGETQQSTLGWTSAGAYYLEIAKDNAATLSLLTNAPNITAPTYQGVGPAMASDLAPLIHAVDAFMTTLQTVAVTQDGTQPPTGAPVTLASKEAKEKSGILDTIFNSLDLSQTALNDITGFLLPTNQIWTDPFGGLLALGQKLMDIALFGFAGAAVLASTTGSLVAAALQAVSFDFGGAIGTMALHMLTSFLQIPIFMLLAAILIPGTVISYVLPMIPWTLWMAGVCGWIILVCEAMIAVPLWMLAHMTVSGDGLHGRAIEGWSLLFSVVFRPVMMVIGLFLGYFVFDCMSWLIRESFGVAAGFALAGGWFVANWIGLVVLLNIFVMTQVTAALMSFRLVALIPHHLPRLIGFTAANRVDHEAFYTQAAWAPGQQIGVGAHRGLTSALRDIQDAKATRLKGQPSAYITEPQGNGGGETGDMDSTLRAITDQSGASQDDV